MKRIAIITSVSGNSAKQLATALNERTHGECSAEIFRPFKDGKTDFREFDYVLSLGCSAETQHKKGTKSNKAKAVDRCVDKPSTFEALKRAGVPTVNYCTHWKDVPKGWATVVIRDKVDGRKAEGLRFVNQCDGEEVPKDGVLYSEHFDHKYEYRIMVWKGEVVGRYHKHDVAGEWFFNLRPAAGFEVMDAACLEAAKALEIDYVGFDVVAVNKKNFRILEANSGAILTEEAEEAITSYYLNA